MLERLVFAQEYWNRNNNMQAYEAKACQWWAQVLPWEPWIPKHSWRVIVDTICYTQTHKEKYTYIIQKV